MQRILSFIVMSFLFFSFVQGGVLKEKQVTPPKDVPRFAGYAKTSIVVKFDFSVLDQIDVAAAAAKGLTGLPAVDQLNRKYGVQKMIQKFPNLPARVYRGRTILPKAWFKVEFKGEVDPEAVAMAYRRVKGVADAQPIGIHTVEARYPNDPRFSDQWHMDQSNDHDMDAPEAWDIETGNADIIVADLDTGVRYFHKDLGGANASYSNPEAARGNMWINWAEKNGTPGVDDDNNGFVDDWIGWDFVDNVNGVSGEDDDVPDNDPRDFNGHGTHTAGIIAAINNNDYAVTSVGGGWENGSQSETGNGIKVMALRIGYSGYWFIFEVGYVSMDFAADAFYYAADNGARIANCSWSSSNTGGLGDAIDYFLAAGGLIFKSAGNDDDEATDYMTDRSDIIAVAATNANDQKADFSSYGTWVDISAPGDNIYSTYHDHSDPENDYVTSLSGTSMASPNAASVAGLIWSHHPDWTADQVKQRLFDTADDIDNISGNESYAGKLGAGRVNAYNAVNDGSGPAAPTADFTADPTSGCAPLTVNFSDASSGEITDWSWDFGDGTTSTEQNPTHTYNNPGNYTVSLTVTGPGGSDTETKTDYITVYQPITADFSGSPTSGDAPLTVNFTDQSTGDVTAWSWDFGDGGTSTEQNPSHEYTAAGTYTVKLTASNSCDSDTKTKTDYITVTEPAGEPPVADFTGSPTSGTAPLLVSFTDQSTNNPTSWSWDFGDGGTSTEQNPQHEYANPGTYTVKLTASNDYGSDTNTKVDYITVTEATQNTMHVGELTVVKESFWFLTRGKADVRIVDESGSPVADATVSGTWSGTVSESEEGNTDSDGWVTFYTGWVIGDGSYTFCVDNVTKTDWVYDESANSATCGSSDGTAAQVVSNVNVDEIEKELGFKLTTNAPNPFNPSTVITFLTPQQSHVTVEIFNILGQRVRLLNDGVLPAGFNALKWNGTDDSGHTVGSGFYFYQITIDGKKSLRRKMLLLK